MEKVKVFGVYADSANKDLGALVEQRINEEINSMNRVVDITVQADQTMTYGKAFVVIRYEQPRDYVATEAKKQTKFVGAQPVSPKQGPARKRNISKK